MPFTRVIAATRHARPRRIAFDVDFADGTVSNLTGENLDPRQTLASLRAENDRWPGFVTFDWMETHEAPAPFTDPRGMAYALVARGFWPEGALVPFLPPPPEPLPPGAIS